MTNPTSIDETTQEIVAWVADRSFFETEDKLLTAKEFVSKRLTILVEQARQEARKQWLREEIVKLEQRKSDDGLGWSDEIKGYNQALDDVITRYKAELNEK